MCKGLDVLLPNTEDCSGNVEQAFNRRPLYSVNKRFAPVTPRGNDRTISILNVLAKFKHLIIEG